MFIPWALAYDLHIKNSKCINIIYVYIRSKGNGWASLIAKYI